MKTLDYADVQTEGKENIFGLFEFIGMKDAENIIQENSFSTSEVEMKVTSIRIPSKNLLALDAVCQSMGITRQDAIGHAVVQFMADAIGGYSFGRLKGFGIPLDENGKELAFENAVAKERDIFIDSLSLDDDMKTYVKDLTRYEFLKQLGLE